MTARHGARAALALGLAASVAGNVIAAQPTPLGRLVAAWPPLALLVAIELVTRIPSRGGALSALRLASAGLLAVIAAWVSYWHLVDLAHLAGEDGIAAHLLPLSVDGLVAVASICLRELSPPTEGLPVPAPVNRRARAATVPSRGGATTAPPAARSEAAADAETGRSPATAARQPPAAPRPPARVLPQELNGRSGGHGVGERVRQLAAEHPQWTQAELAEVAGCSARTVRRHLAAAAPPGTERSLDDEWAELAHLVDSRPAAGPGDHVQDPAAGTSSNTNHVRPHPVPVTQEPTP